MPKKHHQRLYTKPPSTIPTTLGSSFVRSHNQAPTQPQPQSSVNELLHHLRVSQARTTLVTPAGVGSNGPTIGQPRTHHPSVAALIGPDPDPIPLRPRSRIIGSRALPRTTAGPPPPRSWLRCSGSGGGADSRGRGSGAEQSLARSKLNHGGRQGFRLEKLYQLLRLPGLMKVGERSLMHYALVTIARNWEWIMIYEMYYLPTLRPSLKALLGAYIIVYGDGSGMTREGLKVLYPPREKKKKKASEQGDGNDSEDVDSTGAGTIQDLESWDMISSDDDDTDQDPANLKGTTHLDLSYSLGTITTTADTTSDNRSFSLKALERFLFSGHTLPLAPDSDTLEFTSTTLLSPPRLHLPSLTHLSLAYPTNLSTSFLWSGSTPHNLPYILSHIPTLTHLSLAGWPGPPSNSLSHQKKPAIQRLSKSTYCLKWLDLSDWDSDLIEDMFLGESTGPSWNLVWGGYWRAVETVVWCDSRELALPECEDGDGESGEGTGGSSVRQLLATQCELRVSKIRKAVEGAARLKVVVRVDQDRDVYGVDV